MFQRLAASFMTGFVGLSVYASSQSIYQAPLAFRNDQGTKVTLSKWKGRPVVIGMAYTSCSHTCPLILKKMREVEKKLGLEKTADFVVVSFDPENDTPAVWAEYRKKSEITAANWHFLSGSEQATRTLSMLLGIKYKKDPETGAIMHDNKILMLDREGSIAGVLNGLSAPVEELASKVK